MRNKYFVVLTLILLSIPLIGYAQDIHVDLRLFNTHARIFYAGDLDPTGMGTSPNYYSLDLRNTGVTVEMYLHFQLLVENKPIVDAETNVFTLPGDGITYSLTNNQLRLGSILPTDPPQDLKFERFQVSFDLIGNLRRKIEYSGKLPAGVYVFSITAEVTNPPGQAGTVPDADGSNNTLTITNPTTIEPIYPGLRVSQGYIQEVPTTTPHFIWQSDADEFNFYLYEKRPGDKSIQDVLSHEHILIIEGYPGQVFQYPTESGKLIFDDDPIGDGFGESLGPVRLIEAGRTYYWYVEAKVATSSSDPVKLPSDVYQFKITEREKESASADQILSYLRQMLGERYDNYMSELQEYEPTGNLSIQEKPIEIDELGELVLKIIQKD